MEGSQLQTLMQLLQRIPMLPLPKEFGQQMKCYLFSYNKHVHQTIFKNMSLPFTAGRYHSLCADKSSMPHQLHVSAKTEEGEIMGVRHEFFPIEGVQFHPESILTPEGPRLVHNFLRYVK